MAGQTDTSKPDAAASTEHVHKWIDKALLWEPPLKVCECGATMTDTEYRNGPSATSLRDEYPNEDWQERGDTRPHKAHPWSDVVCPGIDGASAAWSGDGEPIQFGESIPMKCAACGKPHPGFDATAAWARPYVCECGSAKFEGTVTFRG